MNSKWAGRTLVAFAIVAVGFGTASAQDTVAPAGRAIAASCAGCHGTNGVSQGGMPSLAGQPKADLVRKMQDFKAGRTPATIMPQLAKGYTDEQIELAAGWLATQKP
ncbi:MAG TPA: c-type cytochrome [Casimicrobiaceae bacterium]|nr:c-type cytochrome [Casimicrobiaceae bacterium]